MAMATAPTLTVRPKDGNGVFISASVAALWADHCYLCDEPKAKHIGLRPLTNQPYCPVLSEDGTRLDGTSFFAANPADCLRVSTHEVGCDCAHGYC